METETKSVFFTKLIRGAKLTLEISQESYKKIEKCYGTRPSRGEKGVKKLKKENLKSNYQKRLIRQKRLISSTDRQTDGWI